jgi:hypothetical protein
MLRILRVLSDDSVCFFKEFGGALNLTLFVHKILCIPLLPILEKTQQFNIIAVFLEYYLTKIVVCTKCRPC